MDRKIELRDTKILLAEDGPWCVTHQTWPSDVIKVSQVVSLFNIIYNNLEMFAVFLFSTGFP